MNEVMTISDKFYFFHYPKKFVFVDLAISISVCHLDHAGYGCVIEVEEAFGQHVSDLCFI
jgi:hypothetical protein